MSAESRIPIWDSSVEAWDLPRVRHSWLWVGCSSPLCGHRRAVPLAPWRIRWGEDDILAAMRRCFRCGACGRMGCVFHEPQVDGDGVEPFPAGRELVIGGERRPDETWPERDARVRTEYLERFPSGDALAVRSAPGKTSL